MPRRFPINSLRTFSLDLVLNMRLRHMQSMLLSQLSPTGKLTASTLLAPEWEAWSPGGGSRSGSGDRPQRPNS